MLLAMFGYCSVQPSCEYILSVHFDEKKSLQAIPPEIRILVRLEYMESTCSEVLYNRKYWRVLILANFEKNHIW